MISLPFSVRVLTALAVFALLTPAATHAVDGKWTPQQVAQLDPAWLRELGLEIPPTELWNEAQGTGLLAATIHVGGCTAGFVSPEGLFATNHHCLFGALQEHSTPERDLIADGYLARTREAELRSKTIRATVPRRFVDVTERVLAAVPAGAGDVERLRAIDRRTAEILAECEAQPATRCKVAAHEGGMQYVLQEMTELDDVRLVYAPPRAVGEYGGEIDNWSWPRHTGDVSIGRVYRDGVPYRPPFHYPISRRDLDPGTFVMIPGYPGTTYRASTAAEMEERRLFFTTRADVFGEWIEILESATQEDPAGAIAVAGNLKSLHNRRKNAAGQLAGLARGKILERQRAADDAVLEWAAAAREKHAAAPGAAAAHAALKRMAAAERASLALDFLLENVRLRETSMTPLGPKALVLGLTVVRGAAERAKPDAERDAAFRDRNLPRVADQLEREQKNLYLPADQALLADWVRRARQLPSVAEAFGAVVDDEAALRAKIDELYAASALFDAAERAKMWHEAPAALRARRDPLLELAAAVDADLRDFTTRDEEWKAVVSRRRPEWRRAVIAHAGRPVAPDANSTLRVTFARVQGYAPRDGLLATAQTTLAGAVAKHTGEEPFAVPAAVLAAAPRAATSPWADPELGDVPVNFLADADTTGGNSGSPVLDGRGALVGLNFDRVWENVANDFGFNPEVARNISVDFRYALWLLDEVAGAKELLAELGLTGDREAAQPASEAVIYSPSWGAVASVK